MTLGGGFWKKRRGDQKIGSGAYISGGETRSQSADRCCDAAENCCERVF